MKLRTIGIGQCGSRVIQDTLSKIFPTVPDSREIRESVGASTLERYVTEALTGVKETILRVGARIHSTITRTIVAEQPELFVMDGNTENAVVRGMDFYGESLRVHLFCQAIELGVRNNGCTVSPIGYSLVRRSAHAYRQKILDREKSPDLFVVIASAAGGTGSGGLIALNEEIVHHLEKTGQSRPGLLNVVVLPALARAEYREKWNSGRTLHKLVQGKGADATVIVSNRQEELEAQFAVNRYICELLLRIINCRYAGNNPPLNTDMDLKDFTSWGLHELIVAGLATQDDLSQEIDVERLVDDAFSYPDPESFKVQGIRGLSSEVPLDNSPNRVASAIVIVGVPKTVKPASLSGVADRLKAAIHRQVDGADLKVYSYGSTQNVELTILLAFDRAAGITPVNTFIETYTSSLDQKAERELFGAMLGGTPGPEVPRVLREIGKAVSDEKGSMLTAASILEDMDSFATPLP